MEQALLKTVEGQTFTDDVLVFDYHCYRNCTIRNCIIIYGGGPCSLNNNTIMDNTMEYRGAAGWALALEQVIGGDEPGVDDLGNVSL